MKRTTVSTGLVRVTKESLVLGAVAVAARLMFLTHCVFDRLCIQQVGLLTAKQIYACWLTEVEL